MKWTFDIEGLGKVEVINNFFLGTYKIYLDDKEFKKLSKTAYELELTGDDVFTEAKTICANIYGSFLSGSYLRIEGKTYNLLTKVPWYAYILSAIPLILSVVLGNMRSLAEAGFYYVGGAIGGGISGLFLALIIYANGIAQKWYYRLLFSLLLIAAAFFICLGIGNAIVHSMSN